MGAFPGAGDLHGELWITDSAADQGRVENKGFHKPVTGTAKYLVFFRLRHAAGRIGAAVDGEAAVIPVDEQTRHAHKELADHLGITLYQSNLSVGKVFLGKCMSVFRHGVFLQRRKCLEYFEPYLIFGEAIYKIETGLPPTHMDDSVDYVEIRVHIQFFFQIRHVIRKLTGKVHIMVSFFYCFGSPRIKRQ